jgi:hypothetical protein
MDDKERIRRIAGHIHTILQMEGMVPQWKLWDLLRDRLNSRLYDVGKCVPFFVRALQKVVLDGYACLLKITPEDDDLDANNLIDVSRNRMVGVP